MDYFKNLKINLQEKCRVKLEKEKLYKISVETVLGYEVNDDVKYIYSHYESFQMCWFNKDNDKYMGEISFVPYKRLEIEHNELVEIMKEMAEYDDLDEGVVQNIMNFYPLFYFPNGDAFCLDIRDGSIRFYDHEVYDGIPDCGIFALKIANSVDELFYKWNKIQFVDVYYWDEACNEDGIDLDSEYVKGIII